MISSRHLRHNERTGRRRLVAVAAVSALVAVGLSPEHASARHRHGARLPASQAGHFDYYVLSLSWSPEHCAEKPGGPDDSQCGTGRYYAFVVHGLWPQYDNGGYPQTCSTANRLSDDVVQRTLDIMPSEDLVRHEWQKHGTCSGLSADAYFERARQAFQRVIIPDRYRDPETPLRVTAASVRSEFIAGNASLPENGIFIFCNGHFLTELRICLSKEDLAARACGHMVSDNCQGEVTVRPLR
jgi:ribonuclease T2